MKNKIIFEENQTGLLQLHDKTHHGKMVKPKVIFVFSGDFIYRHHVEHRVKLYVPTEESFLIPLKCIDVTTTTVTKLDVLSVKHVEDDWNGDGSGVSCRMHGQVSQDSSFERMRKKPLDGKTLSGLRFNKKTNNLKT